jgi:hypothetical protein
MGLFNTFASEKSNYTIKIRIQITVSIYVLKGPNSINFNAFAYGQQVSKNNYKASNYYA